MVTKRRRAVSRKDMMVKMGMMNYSKSILCLQFEPKYNLPVALVLGQLVHSEKLKTKKNSEIIIKRRPEAQGFYCPSA